MKAKRSLPIGYRIQLIGVCLAGLCLFGIVQAAAEDAAEGAADRSGSSPAATRPAESAALPTSRPADERLAAIPVMEPKQTGGEVQSIVQIANLVYAGTRSSRCFSDHFLVKAEKESAISTSRRFHAVKLNSDELFCFPMVIMTGEGDFSLRPDERINLKRFVESGGFMLASAGCSSHEWDLAFRREMRRIFPADSLTPIGMDHPVFHMVYEIHELKAKHGTPKPLEGITINGRLAILYSGDGLNDTTHTQGCCCCGGNELTNAIDINVNVLAYSLVY